MINLENKFASILNVSCRNSEKDTIRKIFSDAGYLMHNFNPSESLFENYITEKDDFFLYLFVDTQISYWGYIFDLVALHCDLSKSIVILYGTDLSGFQPINSQSFYWIKDLNQWLEYSFELEKILKNKGVID